MLEQKNKMLAIANGAKAFYDNESRLWSIRLGDGTYHNRNGGVSEEHAWLVCVPGYFHDRSNAIGLVIDVIAGDEHLEKEFIKHLNAKLEILADADDVPMICSHEVCLLAAPPEIIADSVGLALGLWTEE